MTTFGYLLFYEIKREKGEEGEWVKGGGGEPVGPFVEVCHLFTLHIFMRLKQAIRHLHMHMFCCTV